MLDCRKSDFTLPDGSHYLNGAYMSPLSRAVVVAGTHGVHRKAVPYEILPEHFFSECDEARRLFACLINAAMPTTRKSTRPGPPHTCPRISA